MASDNVFFFSKARVETFSDGIFAIIVTLLVLEIKVPVVADHNSIGALWNALVALLPKVLSWMVSFLMVCVIWVNHHRIFERIKTVTHGVFWLNAILLLWCSFIPFPTALIGDYLHNPLSEVVFGVIMALMSASFSVLRFYLLRHPELLEQGVDLQHYKKATVNSLFFGPGLYLAGATASFVNTYLSFSIFFFIPLYFIFYNSSQKRD